MYLFTGSCHERIAVYLNCSVTDWCFPRFREIFWTLFYERSINYLACRYCIDNKATIFENVLTLIQAQRKPIHHFEGVQCNTDVRTINSSNQDFEFLNHVINPQSIIIQQPPVNRLSQNQSLSQLSGTNVVQNNFVSQTSQDINSGGIDGAHSNVSNTNQHIVINNCSNEPFAQSQLTLSQRQLSTPFSNASNCSSVVVNQNQSSFKTVPPPLVISQQLLNQSVSNQFANKSFIDIPYQQQSQQKNSHINQVTLEENQFSNEVRYFLLDF